MIERFVFCFWVGLALILTAVGANAQAAGDGTSGVLNAIKPALEQAEKAGATVIVVAPGHKTQTNSELVGDAALTDRLTATVQDDDRTVFASDDDKW